MLQGIEFGFQLGFDRSATLESAKRNLPLAYEAVWDYLEREIQAGRIIRCKSQRLSNGLLVHVNRIGVVPKGHATGQWRLITDLSFPEGKSVNDGINDVLCSMAVDELGQVVAGLGRGALMAKIDIKSAYRLLAIHPQDRHLLGCRW